MNAAAERRFRLNQGSGPGIGGVGIVTEQDRRRAIHGVFGPQDHGAGPGAL